MAWTRTLLGLPLLLPLLPLLWAPTEADDRKVVLLAPSEVHGSPGDTVNLTCVLQSVKSEILQVKEIKWERLDSWGDLSTVEEFHWEQGPSTKDSDHEQFVAARKDPDLLEVSLTLTELEPFDEANYTCEVTTFQHGSGRASTWLQVFSSNALTRSHRVQVSSCVPTSILGSCGTHDQEPQAQQKGAEMPPQVSISDDNWEQELRETSLNCDADSNPEPISYEWSTTTGSLPPYAVPQDDLLLLRPSEPINITFICTVSNALGKGQDSINVLLPGEKFPSSLASKQSRSSSFLTISLLVALMVVVLVAVVLVATVYFWFSRKLRQGQRSTLGNEAFLLHPQDRIASEHCRIEVENKAENEDRVLYITT